MKRFDIHIEIGEFIFRDIVSLEVNNSWDTFTDIAVIELRDKFINNNKVVAIGDDSVINRGDPVTIWLNYFPVDTSVQPLFKGFVSDVALGTTDKITCEDSYQLKQINIESKTFTNIKAQELFDFYLKDSGIEYDVIDVNIGNFKVDNNSFVNFIEVLKALKKPSVASLFSWFENGVLKCQLPYSDRNGTKHNYFFNGKNCNIIGNPSMIFKRDDDFAVFVRGESFLENNTRIVRYANIKNGEVHIQTAKLTGQQRNIKVYNKTQTQLDEILTRQVPLIAFEGYEGSFETFGHRKGENQIIQGDEVILKDNKFPRRDGTYIVKSVKTTVAVNGGVRKRISPERRTA